MINNSEFYFEYDHDYSYETNFSCWYSENCRERRFYRDRIYTPDEASYVFRKMYGKYDKLVAFGATA